MEWSGERGGGDEPDQFEGYDRLEDGRVGRGSVQMRGLGVAVVGGTGNGGAICVVRYGGESGGVQLVVLKWDV